MFRNHRFLVCKSLNGLDCVTENKISIHINKREVIPLIKGKKKQDEGRLNSDMTHDSHRDGRAETSRDRWNRRRITFHWKETILSL